MAFHSQIRQDEWVHSVLKGKREGFFVELGACDGRYYSNSLFFEETLGWGGICIEPNDAYFSELQKNRRCALSNALAFSHAGQTVDFSICKAASGILNDDSAPFVNRTTSVKKTTTTLGAILEELHAPAIIDYLSLDVEGAEYAILSTFPFEKYSFRCITVEHNEPHVGPVQQMKIRELLLEKGYKFVKGNDDVQRWGHGPIDDFYIHPSLI
jgi:FkbM family methyltransferase